MIRTFDLTARLSTIAVPTLVLAGDQDILIPTQLSRHLHQLIPASKWATVRGGHACLWEFPYSFNTAYLDFLNESRSSRRAPDMT